MKKGPKRGYFSRSRSLLQFNEKFGKGVLEKNIEKALTNNKTVRVLEIGCGEGRILMELRKIFNKIELYGINKKPWGAMKGSKSLKKTALFYKIFNRNELKNIKLPKIFFYDASKLKFKSNYFNLIYSQVSVPYVKRKDRLLEEIWRVLKINGIALLHIDTKQNNYPDFLKHETPRFIIYRKEKQYPLKRLIKNACNNEFNISYSTYTQKKPDLVSVGVRIIMNKNKNSYLNLNLYFEEISSFDLNRLDPEKKNKDIFWGYRSVYKIK